MGNLMFSGLSEYLSGLYNLYKASRQQDNVTTRGDNSSEAAVASCSQQQLPRVELNSLLTDVAGLVREKSQFTQYLNYTYTVSKNSKPIVLEVLPSCNSKD